MLTAFHDLLEQDYTDEEKKTFEEYLLLSFPTEDAYDDFLNTMPPCVLSRFQQYRAELKSIIESQNQRIAADFHSESKASSIIAPQ